MPEPDWNLIARTAYQEYGAVTNFKNFRGEPMPEFDDLPQQIKTAWDSAVRGAVTAYQQQINPGSTTQTGQSIVKQAIDGIYDR